MGEKVYEALAGSSENSTAPQTAQSQEQRIAEIEEKKRRLKRSMIKFGSLAVFAGIVLIFGSIAWFSNNNSSTAGGMGMRIGTDRFEITMLDNSKNGIFNDAYNKVRDENSLVWKMTATNNLVNYNEPQYENNELTDPGDLGIYPGTEGVISFFVTPKVESLNLSFDFEILGYKPVTDDKGTETEQDDEIVMTSLSDLPGGSGISPQNLLNGHILLFEHKSETTSNGVTTVTYSDPILSDQDMHRIMNRAITGKDVKTPIDIYWVWPNTLSTLIDARSFQGITVVPFCSGTSLDEVKNNFKTYPNYYLKDYNSSGNISDDDLDNIIVHYDIYGDMYDQGDNEIGMSVGYLLIKLSVSEGTAGGGGS